MNILDVPAQATRWQKLRERFPASARHWSKRLVLNNSRRMAEHFYTALMTENELANVFLEKAQIEMQLKHSLKEWLVELVSAEETDTISDFISKQADVGEVHARIGIPMHLVLNGSQALKEFIVRAESEADCRMPPEAEQGRLLLSGLIDHSMELMALSYGHYHDRRERSEEAFRLFSITSDISHERASQRAALLDWENRLMFEQAMGRGEGVQTQPLAASDFGLWIRFKGAQTFEHSTEVDHILASMERIDGHILPRLSHDRDTGDMHRLTYLGEVRNQLQEISYHLDSLFNGAQEVESGRDALTKLLNRKFLDTVLGKMVQYARTSGTSFALLSVDVDWFKSVNDVYGHDTGDTVLQQVAQCLVGGIRSADYAFRLGGEEFLVLLVDTDLARARIIAEKIRRQIEARRHRVTDNEEISVTVSIGLCMHGRHPDYRTDLRRVDKALYRAKREGRNRVVIDE